MYISRSSSSSSSSNNNNSNGDGSKDKRPAVNATDELPTDEPKVDVADEEQLQNHWKSMESRVIHRKLRRIEDAKNVGRGKRLPSAWDHENV